MNRFGVGEVTPLWSAGFVANPFRALSDSEWEDLSLVPEPLRAVLDREESSHIQILGAAGHGKSSALRAVMREAKASGNAALFEYIPVGSDTFSTIPPGDVWFFLDEAQRLCTGERNRLTALGSEANIRHVIGSHEDLTPLFTAAGLRLSTVSLDAPDKAHFDSVLRNRIAHFARPGTPHATLTNGALAFLRHRFGNNLRNTERFLYDLFQSTVRNTQPITEQALNPESQSSR